MRNIFLFILLLQASVVWAQGKSSLTVVGFSDWQNFLLTAKHGEQALRSAGYTTSTLIFPPDESIKPDTPAGNANRDSIQHAFSDLLSDSSKSKVVQIVDHGTFKIEPGTLKGPLPAIYTPGYKMSFEELSKMVSEKKKPNQNLKLISGQCYGGGVHQVSVENQNTCSLSAVPSYRLYTGSKEEMFTFDKVVFDQVKSKGSLMKAYLAGVESDENNLGAAQLSSMYYAQKILLSEATPSFPALESATKLDEYLHEMESALLDCERPIPVSYILDSHSSPLGYGMGTLGGSPAQCPNKSHPLESLKKLNQSLDKIASLQSLQFQLSAEDFKDLPEEYKKAYRKMNASLKEDFAEHKEKLKKQVSDLVGYRQKWNEAEKRFAQCSSTQGNDACTKEFKKEFLQLNSKIRLEAEKIRRDIPDLVKHTNVITNFKYLSRALKSAPPAEKEKLQQLLACEAEAF